MHEDHSDGGERRREHEAKRRDGGSEEPYRGREQRDDPKADEDERESHRQRQVRDDPVREAAQHDGEEDAREHEQHHLHRLYEQERTRRECGRNRDDGRRAMEKFARDHLR